MQPMPVTEFDGRPLPQEATLAGYSALIEHYDLSVPPPYRLTAVSSKNVRLREDGWTILPAQSRPASTAFAHLVFALKYEGIDLLVLKHLFADIEPSQIEAALRAKPTSAYARRIAFLFEWLTERELGVPDTVSGAYVGILNPDQQYAGRAPIRSRRFRILDNLPGTPAFCPLVFRTRAIDALIEKDLSARARHIVSDASPEMIARAAAFLLLKDSKASFDIENESPGENRIARWGTVIGQAGRQPLTIERLNDLQRQLIRDERFVKAGLRVEGGFVGDHGAFGEPRPEHISARHTDLTDLMEGLASFARRSEAVDLHPVLAAASLAFGFVYIHPYQDGNGRIHRFLLHDVLAARRYTPQEIAFPISSVILDDIARYRDVLEHVSEPLLEQIEWRMTDRGNVEVLNDTADYYRYFDATAHAEYLFECIERAVEEDLPNEIAFLEQRDRFHRRIAEMLDMPERLVDLLLRFLRQCHGRLSKRARTHEFAALTDDEVNEIEAIYADLFADRHA